MNKNWDKREQELEVRKLSTMRYAESHTPTDELEHMREALSHMTTEKSDDLIELLSSMFDLMEIILKNQSSERIIEDRDLKPMPEDNSDNNFDLDQESVKKIILEEITIGQVFYPDDVAAKHNLDLRTVMSVISDLKENGKMAEKHD